MPDHPVSDKHVIRWSGWGRWLSFAVATLLMIVSVPLVVSNAPAAGWNIFLALLLFGAVASGHRRAPGVATLLAVLLALRLASLMILGAVALDIAITAMLSLMSAAAAYHLRRQTAPGGVEPEE